MALINENGMFVLRGETNAQVYAAGLATAGTYVDRNIKIEVTAADGAVSAGVNTSAGSASVAETGFTKSTSATDHYVTLTTTPGSATGSASVVAKGWVDRADNKTSAAAEVAVTGNGTKVYIPDGAIGVVATNATNPAVAVSGAATGFAASDTATGYYVTVNGAATKGSIEATATVSETGMVDKGDSFNSSAVDVTPTVSGSGNKVYIPETSLGAAVTGLTAPSVAIGVTSTGITEASGTTKYYVDVTGTGTAGSVKATASNAGAKNGMIASNASATSAASAINPTISGQKKVYIPEGSIAANVEGNITFTPGVSTNMATIAKPSTGTEGTDYFSITGSGSKSGSVTGKATGSEGYIAGTALAATGGSVSGTVSADDKKYIAKAVIAGSGTASANVTVAPGDVSIAAGSGTVTGKTKISATPTTSTSAVGDFYIPIKASVAANSTGATGAISGTVGATVSTAGYAPATLTGSGTVSGTATAKTSAKSSSEYFISLNKAAFSNGVPTGMTDSQFTDISASAPALVSGGYLYIKEGYNANQKISLAKLVPDNASLVAGSSDNIVSGETAYDNDGKLITGSLVENDQAGALVTESTAASGYSYYRVTTSVGYNKTARTTDIPVYQGALVIDG